MRAARAIATVAALLAAAVAAPSATAAPSETAAPPTGYTVIGTASFQLDPQLTGTQSLTVLLAPASSAPTPHVTVIDAAQGEHHPPRLLEAVHATTAPLPGTGDDLVKLTLTSAAYAASGSYTITLQLTAPRFATQTIAVTATRNPGQLQIVTSGASRSRSYLPEISDSSSNATVEVSNVSDTDIAELTVTPQVASANSGTLTTTSGPYAVRAGRSTAIRLRATGHFPIGTTTVPLLLSSPQLPSPTIVTTTVTVQQTVSRAWIVALALLGVLLGWLVRTGLVQLRTTGQQHQRAARLITTITDLKARYPDPAFQTALNTTLATVQAAQNDDDTTLQTALDQADADIATARTAYERARTDALSQAKTLASLVGAAWQIPTTLTAALDAARASLAQANTANEANRPSDAVHILEAAQQTLTTQLNDTSRQWLQTLAPTLHTLADDRPTNIQQAAQACSTTVDGQLGQAPDEAQTLHDLLNNLNTVAHALSNITGMFAALRQQAHTAEQAMKTADRGDPAKLHALITAADTMPSTAAQPTDPDLGAAFQTAAPNVARVMTAADQAIVVLLDPNTMPADRQYVQNAINAGRLHTAASAVIAATNQPNPVGMSMFDAAPFAGVFDLEEDASPANPTGSEGTNQVPQAATIIVSTVSQPLPEITAANLRRQGFAEIFIARLGQSLIAGVIASVLAYLLFATDWTGTTDQLARVVLWGLTINLSTDALLTAASTATKTT